MTRLLQLKTSLFDSHDTEGVSSQLSGELIQGLQNIQTDLQVQTRDFSVEAIPYFDNDWLRALMTPASDRDNGQHEKVAWSDRLIAELQAADSLVIGVPMYNFAMPAMLKSWTDHVARAGVTFKYTDKGAVGLLGAKKVYLVLASGGQHEEGVTDHVRPHLRTMLGFMGLTDLAFVVAEGLNMGGDARALGLQRAREKISWLLEQAGSALKLEEVAPGTLPDGGISRAREQDKAAACT